MHSAADAASPRRRVPPFGHPRINARLRLPGAFRRSPRPSSAPSAQASTVRLSYFLSLRGFSVLKERVRRSRDAIFIIAHSAKNVKWEFLSLSSLLEEIAPAANPPDRSHLEKPKNQK